MKSWFGMLAALLLFSGGTARADLVADGITYSLTGVGTDTSTADFTLHITGINGALDTELGRFGVQSFAFTTANISLLSGTSSFGSFLTGGLDAGGCNGSGGFFCFSGSTPSGPALAADSTIDISFSLALISGDFLSWSPDFKINWIGTKNNYDLVSLPLSDAPSAVPLPPAVWLFGSGLLGLFTIRKKLAA